MKPPVLTHCMITPDGLRRKLREIPFRRRFRRIGARREAARRVVFLRRTGRRRFRTTRRRFRRTGRRRLRTTRRRFRRTGRRRLRTTRRRRTGLFRRRLRTTRRRRTGLFRLRTTRRALRTTRRAFRRRTGRLFAVVVFRRRFAANLRKRPDAVRGRRRRRFFAIIVTVSPFWNPFGARKAMRRFPRPRALGTVKETDGRLAYTRGRRYEAFRWILRRGIELLPVAFRTALFARARLFAGVSPDISERALRYDPRPLIAAMARTPGLGRTYP